VVRQAVDIIRYGHGKRLVALYGCCCESYEEIVRNHGCFFGVLSVNIHILTSLIINDSRYPESLAETSWDNTGRKLYTM
jgi:putative NIF3 family GTP cyclohydrolase 1 type 2